MKKIANTFLLTIFLWGVFFLLPRYTSATVVKPMDLTELTAEADLIFRGKVLSVNSRWDETRSNIWTYVTFSVDELIKGPLPDQQITLKLPGGAIEAQNIRLRVDGVPEYKSGEEVLIFCNRDSTRRNPMIGWYQGSFKIMFDSQLGQEVIVGKRASELMQARRGLDSKDSLRQEMTYKEFVEGIRKIIATKP